MIRTLACLLCIAGPAHADVEAIINQNLPLREISRSQARDVYLLKERYGPAGNRPQLYRMPMNSRLHKEFVRDILGLTQAQFEKEWNRLVNTGLAIEIEEVQNEREMLAMVSRRARGVGYLSKDYLVLNMIGTGVEIVRILP